MYRGKSVYAWIKFNKSWCISTIYWLATECLWRSSNLGKRLTSLIRFNEASKHQTKVENALEKVCAGRRDFRWDEEKCVSVGFRTKFDQTEIGLRAQQVQEQIPEIVTAAPFDKDEEGNSKSEKTI